MRKITAGASAASCALLALLMLSAACSSPSGPPGGKAGSPGGTPGSTPSGTSGAPAPQLTPAQARQAFNAFLPSFNAMLRNHDAKLVPQLTVGAETQVQTFAARNAAGLPVPAQVSDQFYVPRLSSYPRWFAAIGTTRSQGTSGGDLFLMVQSRHGGPWQEAEVMTWFGPAAAQLSGIAVDPQGYATAVDPAATSLAIPPGQLPAQYTQFIGGAQGASSSVFAPGDATTGWIAGKRTVVTAAPAKGWQASFAYTVPALPVFALRTTSGGALVFFAFDQDSAWTAKSTSPHFAGGVNSVDGRMPLILAVEAGLNSPHVRQGTRINSTQRHETLAVDPASGHGQISLLPSELDGGGVTSATMG
jgi:hypothetical protein